MTVRPEQHIWDQETVERYWRYLGQFPETYFSYHRSKDIVWRARHYIERGSKVLDYGCGPGYLLPALVDAGYITTGADISLEAIGKNTPQITSENFNGFRTISDLTDAGEKFRAAFLIEVVEHLYDECLSEAFSNLRTLIRPGGVLIITTPNNENLSANEVYCPISDVVFHKWQHVRNWTKDSLTSRTESEGFSVIDAKTLNFRGNRAMTSLPRRIAGLYLASRRMPSSLMIVARR